jgi:hypothetical protein
MISAFGIDVGTDDFDEAIDPSFLKQHDVIHGFEAEKHFGPIFFAVDRPPLSLEFPDGSIAVQADDEGISQRARLPQVADMTCVQDIKATIGKNEPTAFTIQLIAPSGDFLQSRKG